MKLPRIDRDRTLVFIAVVACLAFTLYIEHWLAAEVLEVPGVLAVAFPVALDSYVLAAMRTHQDRVWAFGLSAVAQGAAGWAAVAGGAEGAIDKSVQGVLRAGFGIAVTMVLWRVHVILHALNEEQRAAVTVVIEETVTVPAGPDRVGALTPDRTTGPDHPELMDRTTGPDQLDQTGPGQADQPDRTTTEAPDRTGNDAGPGRPSMQLVRTGPVPSGRVKELLPTARKTVTAFAAEHGREPGQKKLAELLRARGESCSVDVAIALLTEIRAETERKTAHG